MTQTRGFFSFILMAGLVACNSAPFTPGPSVYTPGPDETLALRSGTSFGMCLGYCTTELVVTNGDVSLTRTSREPGKYPPTTQSLSLTASEREALRAALASSDLRSSKGVYGCPDCADGGAEWVEVGGRRVTLEYGADIEPIRPLLNEIRKLRSRLTQSK